jgi:hypothetical protein
MVWKNLCIDVLLSSYDASVIDPLHHDRHDTREQQDHDRQKLPACRRPSAAMAEEAASLLNSLAAKPL